MHYAIGFRNTVDSLQHATTDCTVTFLQPLANALTRPLAEPARLQITVTGANPSVRIEPSTVALPRDRRMIAGLGMRVVNGQQMWCGYGSFTQLQILNGEATNFAYQDQAFNSLVFKPFGFAAPGTVFIVDIGRFWQSDVMRVVGAPFEQWSDGLEDSGFTAESIGYQASARTGAKRDLFVVPLTMMTEQETYFGEPPSIVSAGYNSAKAAFKHSANNTEIVAGRFDEIATGSLTYKASSDQIGVCKLVYGRMINIDSIERSDGPVYKTSVTIAEEF